MQMASRTNAAWGVAGNIGLRPHKKYPRLGRGIFISDEMFKAVQEEKQKRSNIPENKFAIGMTFW